MFNIHTLSFKSLPNGQAWALAWPMILSNMSVPLMGLADTAMLGHLDSPIFLGAVAIGTSIIALFYWMFSFLRMGTTSIVAHAFGAQKLNLVERHLSQNISLALCLGLFLILAKYFLFPIALWLIAPDPKLLEVAKSYCDIRVYSAPAVFTTYVCVGWLIALKHAKATLVITVSSNVINIVLDYLFIMVLDYQAKGAASATLIAEYTALALSLFFIRKELSKLGIQLSRKLDLKNIHINLKLNFDLFVRTTTLLIVINFFNAQSAGFGPDILAANAILFQCMLFTSFFLDGYAQAAETLTAQALGAKRVNDFHRASLVTATTALLIAIVLSLAFALGGQLLINLLTSISSVSDVAKRFLPWLIAAPLVSVWCYALDGIFIGAGQARMMRNNMLFSAILGFLPCWWIFSFLGNHGLWLAFLCFNLCRGITLAWTYLTITRRGTWLPT